MEKIIQGIKDNKKYNENTIKTKISCAKKFFEFVGEKELDFYTAKDFFKTLKRKKLKQSTLLQYFYVLDFIYKEITDIDISKLKPSYDNSIKISSVLSEKTILLILNDPFFSETESLFLKLYYYMSIPIRELQNLTIKDLVFKKDKIFIGKKKTPFQVEHEFMLHSLFLNQLCERIKRKDIFVFRSRNTYDKPINIETLQKKMRKKLNEYDKSLTIYSIKYSYAYKLWVNETPVESIANYMGHKNINLTKKMLNRFKTIKVF